MKDWISVTLRAGVEMFSGTYYADDIDFNINALEVAREELRKQEAAKPIPPGTRVRYKAVWSDEEKWYYGTVAAPGAKDYYGVETDTDPKKVWAYWDYDPVKAPTFIYRSQAEIV